MPFLGAYKAGSRVALREARVTTVRLIAARRQLELGLKRRRGTRVAGSKVKWR